MYIIYTLTSVIIPSGSADLLLSFHFLCGKYCTTYFKICFNKYAFHQRKCAGNLIHIIQNHRIVLEPFLVIFVYSTLSQITRDFSRYRWECNCQKAIYIGTVRDWQQLKYLGTVRDSPTAAPIPPSLRTLRISRNVS